MNLPIQCSRNILTQIKPFLFQSWQYFSSSLVLSRFNEKWGILTKFNISNAFLFSSKTYYSPKLCIFQNWATQVKVKGFSSVNARQLLRCRVKNYYMAIETAYTSYHLLPNNCFPGNFTILLLHSKSRRRTSGSWRGCCFPQYLPVFLTVEKKISCWLISGH